MRQARRDQASGRDMRAAHRAVGEVRQEVRADLQGLREPLPELKAELRIGDLVTVRSLRKSGKVVALQGKRVEVDLSGMRITVKRSELAGHDGPSPRARLSPPCSQRGAASGTSGADHAEQPGSSRHARRGGTREQSISSKSRGQPRRLGLVLHGHGTGALKERCGTGSSGRAGCPRRPALPERGGRMDSGGAGGSEPVAADHRLAAEQGELITGPSASSVERRTLSSMTQSWPTSVRLRRWPISCRRGLSCRAKSPPTRVSSWRPSADLTSGMLRRMKSPSRLVSCPKLSSPLICSSPPVAARRDW